MTEDVERSELIYRAWDRENHSRFTRVTHSLLQDSKPLYCSQEITKIWREKDGRRRLNPLNRESIKRTSWGDIIRVSMLKNIFGIVLPSALILLFETLLIYTYSETVCHEMLDRTIDLSHLIICVLKIRSKQREAIRVRCSHGHTNIRHDDGLLSLHVNFECQINAILPDIT